MPRPTPRPASELPLRMRRSDLRAATRGVYLAPEFAADGLLTAAADVYALGVLLFQVLVANLQAPLTAGWKARVSDPLFRRDIAAAASGDVDHRLMPR